MRRRSFLGSLGSLALSAAPWSAAPFPDLRGRQTGPDYRSAFLAVGLSRHAPAFSVFTVDSLGRGHLGQNPALPVSGPMAGVELDGQAYKIHGRPVWGVAWSERTLTLRSDYAVGVEAPAFALTFDQKANHATLLGLMKPGERRMPLPCVLHLPDMGTVRITGARLPLEYDARRRDEAGVRAHRVPAGDGGATARRVPARSDVHLSEAAGHRERPALRRLPARLAQHLPGQSRACRCWPTTPPAIRARSRCSSIPTSPRHTPPLADGLTANDLVRMTLDRYLAGAKGYGQVGYADPELGRRPSCLDDALDDARHAAVVPHRRLQLRRRLGRPGLGAGQL